MNNQEAITLLRNLEDSLDSYCELNEEGKTAFRMAIEALNCSEIPNNSDTISRQAVTKFLNDWLSCLFENCHKQSASDLKMIIKDFKNLPSIQPERKTGHWVYRPEWSKYSDVWSCSECGEKTSQSVMGEPRFKYCPMCGAKMENGGKQE